MDIINEIIEKMLLGNIQTKQNILNSHEQKENIKKIIEVIINAYKNGRKVLAFGNGGSACDALHLTGELVGRYKMNRKPLKAIALPADPAVLTCVGNDYGYENIFARQVEAHAEKGDIAIGYSTSGTSKNVILALKKAREMGMVTIGMGGGKGGDLPNVCDYLFLAPTEKTAHMQEAHLAFTHILCEAIDLEFG
jgi:D-sedoheptulose 7-phosphate isomerase